MRGGIYFLFYFFVNLTSKVFFAKKEKKIEGGHLLTFICNVVLSRHAYIVFCFLFVSLLSSLQPILIWRSIKKMMIF